MPSKKKKYNARFPAGRIKKIMQSDEEIGKVAQAVPVIISRTLELFVESLLTKTLKITNSRNARTLSTSHMKQCIMSEQRFDFLRELVKNIPEISVAEEAANYNDDEVHSSPEETYPDSDTPFDLSMPSTSTKAYRIPAHNGDEQNVAFTVNTNPHSRTDEQSSRAHLKRQSSGNPTYPNSQGVTKPRATHATSAKVSRSDSTPNPVQYQPNWQQASTMSATGTTTATSTTVGSATTQQKTKSRQQSSVSAQDIGNSSSSTNFSQSKQQSASKHHHQQQQSQAAIPSPIVSFDFCNKPVVKIDYSNIAMSTINSDAPISAPHAKANENGLSKSAFNFNQTEPIINIDLSNMIQPNTLNTTGLVLPASNSSSALHNTQKDTLMTVPLSSNNSINKTSCFELDEDYDNI